MKKYSLFLAGIFCAFILTGCSRNFSANDLSTNENSVLSDLTDGTLIQTEQGSLEDQSSNSISSAEEDTAAYDDFSKCTTVEYSYQDLYLSVDIPDTWNYEIKTAEDRAKEDGLVTCSICFRPEKYADAVFELSYSSTRLGMCATGVTIEHFTLPNGISGISYTETIEDIVWMTFILNNPYENLEDRSDGTYFIQASIDISVWEEIKEEFEQVLDSVWVGTDIVLCE